MQARPHLDFDGRCEEAVEFYRRTLGAEVDFLMRFEDSPDPPELGMPPAGASGKVLHMSFRVGDMTFLASDGRCQGRPSFQGFAVSLSVPDEAEARRLFTALTEGGQVQMPLTKTFWSPLFGIVSDRFGLAWMIQVAT
jgi:PhnB protein